MLYEKLAPVMLVILIMILAKEKLAQKFMISAFSLFVLNNIHETSHKIFW